MTEPSGDLGELGGEMRDFRQTTMASFNAMREDLARAAQRLGRRSRKRL